MKEKSNILNICFGEYKNACKNIHILNLIYNDIIDFAFQQAFFNTENISFDFILCLSLFVYILIFKSNNIKINIAPV